MNIFHPNRYLSPFQSIILGFAAVIMLGGFMLCLPAASANGESAPLIDAMFTSTSAVCVTGLVVRDTATSWSPLGQAIILLLIQIGGLGVVTVAGAFTVLSGRKINLLQRSTMQEAIAAPKMGGVVKLILLIIKITLLIELLGATILAPSLCSEFGPGKGLWYSLFHSVSAFCNAGFDLMGVKAHYSSLTSYSASPLINITVMLLIITGGMGFLTWKDIFSNKLCIRKYHMQSKVILITTALLIIIPAAFFFFFEFNSYPLSERILLSLFQAVTPRTAGFNTADIAAMKESSRGIIIFLMLIGGSPGSTAGGMKTTTLAVLMLSALAVFRRREAPSCFDRRLSNDAVIHAVAILMMYIILFFTTGIAISTIEGLPASICLFETASAIGTVGLTLGITPSLGTASRLILMALMFLGRVGGLTIIYAALSTGQGNTAKLPQEHITIG